MRQNQFQLREVSTDEVKKPIQALNKKKSVINFLIPVKYLIESMDIYSPIFTDIIYHALKNDIFPEELKLAEVIPLFKKAGLYLKKIDKINYWPLSLLSHMSKVFGKIILKQINEFIEPFLSNLLNGFRKTHDTQHSLLKILENVKKL